MNFVTFGIVIIILTILTNIGLHKVDPYSRLYSLLQLLVVALPLFSIGFLVTCIFIYR
jgi:hypothetical protein